MKHLTIGYGILTLVFLSLGAWSALWLDNMILTIIFSIFALWFYIVFIYEYKVYKRNLKNREYYTFIAVTLNRLDFNKTDDIKYLREVYKYMNISDSKIKQYLERFKQDYFFDDNKSIGFKFKRTEK